MLFKCGCRVPVRVSLYLRVSKSLLLFDNLYIFLVQKDLKLSLNMGDQLEQPLPLTASANEVGRNKSNQPMRDCFA
jgi:hypothetical protein